MNRHNDCLGGACAPRLCRYHQHIPNGRRFEADTIAFAAAKIPLRREKTNFSRLNLLSCVPRETVRPGGVGRNRRERYFPEQPSGGVAERRSGELGVLERRSRGPESGYKAGGIGMADGAADGRVTGRVTDRVVPQGRNGGRPDGRRGEDGRRGAEKTGRQTGSCRRSGTAGGRMGGKVRTAGWVGSGDRRGNVARQGSVVVWPRVKAG